MMGSRYYDYRCVIRIGYYSRADRYGNRRMKRIWVCRDMLLYLLLSDGCILKCIDGRLCHAVKFDIGVDMRRVGIFLTYERFIELRDGLQEV